MNTPTRALKEQPMGLADKKFHTPASRAVELAEAGVFPGDPVKSDKLLWNLRVMADLAIGDSQWNYRRTRLDPKRTRECGER